MADDFTANIATAGSVAVNGFATGNIETNADHDWFRVGLTAGHTYIISEDGVPGGAGTLPDTFVRLRDNAGNAILNAFNDDHLPVIPFELDSQFVFTPGASGTFYIDAGAFLDAGTGTYRVSVVESGAVPVFTGAADTVIVPQPNGAWYGLAGDDKMSGTRGADILFGEGGNDKLDGGNFDVLNGHQGEVFRLYEATLARAPDVGGFNGWVAELDRGTPLLNLVSGFVNSTEFQNTYGNLSNTDFVTLLYDNVLHRAPDQNGLSTWVGILNSGGSREGVVLGFSESPEFVQNTTFQSEGWATATLHGNNYGAVYRLYEAALAREPDGAGFTGWINSLANGAQLSNIAAGFVGSTEFQNTYGTLTDTAFVTLLYNNVLHRAPDANGLAGWVSALNGGATRENVLIGFSESQEFTNNTAVAVQNFLSNSVPSWNDSLIGGSGANQELGGRGADTFVFDRFDGNPAAASHDVFGVQTWDTLQFDHFNYTSANQVLTHMTQNHSDVIFNDQNVTVTLHDTTIADLTHTNIALFN